MNEEIVSIDMNKFKSIKQKPMFCVPCAVSNLLNYLGIEMTQDYLFGLLISRSLQPGFREFYDILPSLIGQKYDILWMEKKNTNNDTQEKCWNNIVRLIERGYPVAVSFRNQYGGAHVRVAVAYSKNQIKFFEQETGEFLCLNYKEFSEGLKEDNHILAILNK